MRKITCLLFSFCIFLSSCQKESEPPTIIWEAGNQMFGWAEGTKNGLKWESSDFWHYHTNDSLHIGINFYTYTDYGALRENFTLNEIPLKIGTYPCKGGYFDLGDNFVGAKLGLSQDDEDVLLGIMDLDEAEDSFITIESIDETTGTIRGSFDLHYVNNDNISGIPKRIHLLNGIFEAREYE